MQKMRILVVGNDFHRTIYGYTDMSVEDVHAHLRTLDADELRTVCAAMEVFDDIDMVINNVKNGCYYLTGSDDLVEEAEYLLVNDAYWGDEKEPDITAQELAEEIKFDSTYHETSLGVLKTD